MDDRYTVGRLLFSVGSEIFFAALCFILCWPAGLQLRKGLHTHARLSAVLCLVEGLCLKVYAFEASMSPFLQVVL